MQEGTVKWFSTRKGYGFISPKQGRKDIFIHIKELYKAGYEWLKEGEPVEFTVKEDRYGRPRVDEIVVYEYV